MCKYCGKQEDILCHNDNDSFIMLVISKDKRLCIKTSTQIDDHTRSSMQRHVFIKFCPMCGKKL